MGSDRDRHLADVLVYAGRLANYVLHNGPLPSYVPNDAWMVGGLLSIPIPDLPRGIAPQIPADLTYREGRTIRAFANEVLVGLYGFMGDFLGHLEQFQAGYTPRR